MKKFAFAVSFAIASLGAAQAQERAQAPAPAPVQEAAPAPTFVEVNPAGKPMRFVIGAGVTAGGDKLATAYYEDGDEIDLNAGDGFVLKAGFDYRIEPAFSVQGTIGYHTDRAPAKNGDMRFVRIPMELLGYYHVNEKVRVGGGIRFLTNTEFRSEGASDIGDYKFDASVSPVAELEYLFTPSVGVTLRYVNDKFKEKRSGGSAKGDHVGVMVNFYF